MSNIHCFTSASFSYMDRVRVLGETVRRHHPDWKMWLCLGDVEPPGFTFNLSLEPVDCVVRLDELGIPDLNKWLFKHDVIELCTAIKGPMLRYLLKQGAEKVIYLDPDIALFNSLEPVINLLDYHPILLTPHQLDTEECYQAIIDNEISSLKYGVYNLGFLGVRNCPEGQRFAEWWRDRLLQFCYDDIPKGLFTDQRWCDLVPAFFRDVHILRDPGYNVASWNLSHRPISIDPEGTIYAAGCPLRFFHFTKVNSIGMAMLERYGHKQIALFEIVNWYKKRLAANAPAGLIPGWWGFGQYRDGTSIPKEHRIAYRNYPELCKQFPDPFAAGRNSLSYYLENLHASDVTQ